MLAERYTTTIIRGKAEERYPSSIMHAGRGYSLVSILGGLFRRALPFLLIGANILDQQDMNVATDMIDGKSFRDRAKSRFTEGITTFVRSNPSTPVWQRSEKEASPSVVKEAE